MSVSINPIQHWTGGPSQRNKVRKRNKLHKDKRSNTFILTDDINIIVKKL